MSKSSGSTDFRKHDQIQKNNVSVGAAIKFISKLSWITHGRNAGLVAPSTGQRAMGQWQRSRRGTRSGSSRSRSGGAPQQHHRTSMLYHYLLYIHNKEFRSITSNLEFLREDNHFDSEYEDRVYVCKETQFKARLFNHHSPVAVENE